jgi:hypothetical protein
MPRLISFSSSFYFFQAVLINQNATGAKEHLEIVDEKEEEDEECNNPILFTGNDVSCS